MESNHTTKFSQYEASFDEIRKLISIIEEVANGKYSNDIMEFTKPGHSKTIQRIAEAVGMMMVRVEAREMRLEQLIEELRELNALLKKNIIQTVITIANALGARDQYSEGHAQRVAIYSERLARKVELTEEEVETIKIGGMLHDIGKIGFSDRMFTSEDVKFSKDMIKEIRHHPKIGANILKDIEFLGPVLEYVRHHHESVDGTGYPDGIRDEEIPMGAKIISVADCFDAITTERSYQKGRDEEEASVILRSLSGKGLSAELVEAFIEEIKENGML
jgi:putative nucleotidyltransferase with HDIG domain